MWLRRGFLPITIPLPILERQQKFSRVFVTVKLASHFELIGSLVAGDSTKLRPKTPRKIISTSTKLNVTSLTSMLD
jgi:hypothetical protein